MEHEVDGGAGTEAAGARRAARARALRAACAVTLGLATVGLASAGVAGCAESHVRSAELDAGGPLPDGYVPPDAYSPPDAYVADAGCPPFSWETPPASQRCCEDAGFWWDSSANTCIVAVPGPFVPPAMA